MRIACKPDVRRHGSSRGAAGGEARIASNSSAAHSTFPGICELAGEDLVQRDEQLDVQRGVGEPLPGEWAGAPVGRRMLLPQTHMKPLLDHRAEGDPLVAEQPAGQFGVEQPSRTQSELGEARQILGSGVQDPLGLVDDVGERPESREYRWVTGR